MTIDYINKVSNRLFGINVAGHIESVGLVNKEMFYFKFGATSSTMLLPGKIDIVKLMPRRIANRIIFNSIVDTVEEQLANNGANLKWEYICKLRDSKFIFERLFREKIYSLIDQTQEMVEKMIQERERAKENIEDLVEYYKGIKQELQKLNNK